MAGQGAGKPRVHIFGLDHILVSDVYERLHEDGRFGGVQLVVPREGQPGITVEDLEAVAKDTVSSRVMVLDVRSQTRAKVQQVYNRVIGYNRAQLNQSCFTLLIGDGPANLFGPGTSVRVFAGQLAKLRIDYSAAVFFYDPFLHYRHDEKLELGISQSGKLPHKIPERLAKGFKAEDVHVGQIRRYFRAAGLSDEKRESSKQKRREQLAKFLRKRIAKAFPEEKKELEAWLSKDGYEIAGEALRLNMYPFWFEDWVWELLGRA